MNYKVHAPLFLSKVSFMIIATYILNISNNLVFDIAIFNRNTISGIKFLQQAQLPLSVFDAHDTTNTFIITYWL